MTMPFHTKAQTKSNSFFRSASIALAGLTVLGATLVQAAPGQGGRVYFETSMKPVFSESNNYASDYGGSLDGTEFNADKTVGYDARTTLGYTFGGWALIGFTLNSSSVKTTRDASAGVDGKSRNLSYFEWGPTVGYAGSNWRFLFSYLIQGEKKWADKATSASGTASYDAEVTNTLGSAYQFTAGYAFNISPRFSIGPTLIYRMATYKSQTLNNKLDSSANYTDKTFTSKPKETELLPYLSLMARF